LVVVWGGAVVVVIKVNGDWLVVDGTVLVGGWIAAVVVLHAVSSARPPMTGSSRQTNLFIGFLPLHNVIPLASEDVRGWGWLRASGHDSAVARNWVAASSP
jgi:hypothetical protein